MKFKSICGAMVCLVWLSLSLGSPSAQAAQPAEFPVSPHDNVSIEWWYLNTHVTTDKGRHLAIIASFFRLGNAASAAAASAAKTASLSHYLIYAITDENAHTHSAYSLGDQTTLHLIQQLATLMVMQNPGNQEAQKVLEITGKGQFPPPTQLISGSCQVTDAPFAAVYGNSASVKAISGTPNAFNLDITSGMDKIDLTFSSTRPPMYVNGDGNTGVVKRDDMKYVSLTRCAVTGTLSMGAAAEKVTTGEGWFDHQWGSSWTPQSIGWDWWGIQLDDGRDILMYRLFDIGTGKPVASVATIEDSTGKQTVTKNIKFMLEPAAIWDSPISHVRYPLKWTVDMPDENLSLVITPEMQDQEMPVLANGGAIWEGTCSVSASTLGGSPNAVSGKAYMELVGYGTPAAKRLMRDLSHPFLR